MTETERKAWMSTIRAGDKVAIRSRRAPMPDGFMSATVQKILSTRLDLLRSDGVEVSCRRTDGGLLGDYTRRPHIEPFTGDIARRIRTAELRVWLAQLGRRLDAESDLAMLEALKSAHDAELSQRGARHG